MSSVVKDAPDPFHVSHVHVYKVIVATISCILGTNGVETLLIVAEFTTRRPKRSHVFSIDLRLQHNERIVRIPTKTLLVRTGEITHGGRSDLTRAQAEIVTISKRLQIVIFSITAIRYTSVIAIDTCHIPHINTLCTLIERGHQPLPHTTL